MVLSCLGGGDPNQRLEICRRSCNSQEKDDSVYFSFPRWIVVVETELNQIGEKKIWFI